MPSVKYLLDQAERSMASGDAVGAEIHLNAAISVAQRDGELEAHAHARVELARLRLTQRRSLAARQILEEERARLTDAAVDGGLLVEIDRLLDRCD